MDEPWKIKHITASLANAPSNADDATISGAATCSVSTQHILVAISRTPKGIHKKLLRRSCITPTRATSIFATLVKVTDETTRMTELSKLCTSEAYVRPHIGPFRQTKSVMSPNAVSGKVSTYITKRSMPVKLQ